MPPEPTPPIVGILLAGGLSRRMGGGDKCLKPLGGRPMLEHVIARAAPQVRTLVINANGDPARFSGFGLPVAADTVGGFAGPLAGVLTGMEWTRAHRPDCPWVVTFATDAPFFPADLVARLLAATGEGRPITCAASGGRAHPVFALWPTALADDLARAVTDEGVRKVDVWTARHGIAEAAFPDEPHDPFFNVNTEADLAEAEQLMRSLGRRTS